MALNSSSQERIARVLLRVGLDKQELTNTKQQLEVFNKTLADLERQKALNKLAQDSARAVSEGKSLRAELGRLKASLIQVGAEGDEIAKVVREFDRLNEAASKATASASAGTGNKLLRSLGTDIRNLPAVGIPGAGGLSTDVVGKVLNTIGRLNVDLKTLAVSGGLASVAIIGVGVAFQELVDKPLRAIQALTTQIIRSRAELAGFLATATPQEIVDKQKAAQDAVTETSRKIASTTQDLDTSYRVLRDSVLGVAVGVAQIITRSGSVGDALNDLDKYNQELTDQQIVLEGLNTVLEQNQRLLEQATFDYAAYQQALTDKNFFSALQTELSLRQMNAAAIRENITNLEDEQRRLQDAFANQLTLGLSGEAVIKITDRLAEIGNLLPLYQQALPEAQARERLENFAKGILKIPDAVRGAAKLIEDVQKATAAIGELREEHGQRLADIQNRLRDQLSEAARDRDIALSEASRDAEIARSEAARKAGLERVEIERQSAKAIQQIMRRARLDINNAIANRDAVALDAARARRDEELAAEESNRAERLRKLDLELREQLRTIDIRLREQNRTIAMRYDESVRRAALAANKSIEIETIKYQKELALKTQEVQRILGLEQQKVTAAINGATATQNITATFWQNMVTQAKNAVSALTSGAATVKRFGNPGASSGGKVPSMDSGGEILKTGIIRAHRGEFVINPARRNQQGMAGLTINIEGLNKRQILTTVGRKLDEYLLDNFA